MQPNRGLPIKRLARNDNAVDISIGLRAEQAEMHKRSRVVIDDGLDAHTIVGFLMFCVLAIAGTVAAVIFG